MSHVHMPHPFRSPTPSPAAPGAASFAPGASTVPSRMPRHNSSPVSGPGAFAVRKSPPAPRFSLDVPHKHRRPTAVKKVVDVPPSDIRFTGPYTPVKQVVEVSPNDIGFTGPYTPMKKVVNVPPSDIRFTGPYTPVKQVVEVPPSDIHFSGPFTPVKQTVKAPSTSSRFTGSYEPVGFDKYFPGEDKAKTKGREKRASGSGSRSRRSRSPSGDVLSAVRRSPNSAASKRKRVGSEPAVKLYNTLSRFALKLPGIVANTTLSRSPTPPSNSKGSKEKRSSDVKKPVLQSHSTSLELPKSKNRDDTLSKNRTHAIFQTFSAGTRASSPPKFSSRMSSVSDGAEVESSPIVVSNHRRTFSNDPPVYHPPKLPKAAREADEFDPFKLTLREFLLPGVSSSTILSDVSLTSTSRVTTQSTSTLTRPRAPSWSESDLILSAERDSMTWRRRPQLPAKQRRKSLTDHALGLGLTERSLLTGMKDMPILSAVPTEEPSTTSSMLKRIATDLESRKSRVKRCSGDSKKRSSTPVHSTKSVLASRLTRPFRRSPDSEPHRRRTYSVGFANVDSDSGSDSSSRNSTPMSIRPTAASRSPPDLLTVGDAHLRSGSRSPRIFGRRRKSDDSPTHVDHRRKSSDLPALVGRGRRSGDMPGLVGLRRKSADPIGRQDSGKSTNSKKLAKIKARQARETLHALRIAPATMSDSEDDNEGDEDDSESSLSLAAMFSLPEARVQPKSKPAARARLAVPSVHTDDDRDREPSRSAASSGSSSSTPSVASSDASAAVSTTSSNLHHVSTPGDISTGYSLEIVVEVPAAPAGGAPSQMRPTPLVVVDLHRHSADEEILCTLEDVRTTLRREAQRQGDHNTFASFSFLYGAQSANHGREIPLWSESRFLAREFVPAIYIRPERSAPAKRQDESEESVAESVVDVVDAVKKLPQASPPNIRSTSEPSIASRRSAEGADAARPFILRRDPSVPEFLPPVAPTNSLRLARVHSYVSPGDDDDMRGRSLSRSSRSGGSTRRITSPNYSTTGSATSSLWSPRFPPAVSPSSASRRTRYSTIGGRWSRENKSDQSGKAAPAARPSVAAFRDTVRNRGIETDVKPPPSSPSVVTHFEEKGDPMSSPGDVFETTTPKGAEPGVLALPAAASVPGADPAAKGKVMSAAERSARLKKNRDSFGEDDFNHLRSEASVTSDDSASPSTNVSPSTRTGTGGGGRPRAPSNDEQRLFVMLGFQRKPLGFVDLGVADGRNATLRDVRDVITSQMAGLPSHFAFLDKFSGEQMPRKQEYLTKASDCLPSVSITAVSANEACSLNIAIEGEVSPPIGTLSFPANEVTLKDLRMLIESELGSFSSPYVFTSRGVPVGVRQEELLFADEFMPELMLRLEEAQKSPPRPRRKNMVRHRLEIAVVAAEGAGSSPTVPQPIGLLLLSYRPQSLAEIRSRINAELDGVPHDFVFLIDSCAVDARDEVAVRALSTLGARLLIQPRERPPQASDTASARAPVASHHVHQIDPLLPANDVHQIDPLLPAKDVHQQDPLLPANDVHQRDPLPPTNKVHQRDPLVPDADDEMPAHAPLHAHSHSFCAAAAAAAAAPDSRHLVHPHSYTASSGKSKLELPHAPAKSDEGSPLSSMTQPISLRHQVVNQQSLLQAPEGRKHRRHSAALH